MDVYRTEEEQVAAIQRWWQENYKVVIAAILLAVASFGAWKWYQHYQREQSLAAAALYEGMMKSAQEILAGGPAAADAVARMQRAGETLISDHEGSVYSQYGALLLAGNAAEVDDYAGAEKYLRIALAVGGGDGTRVIIENRLARVRRASMTMRLPCSRQTFRSNCCLFARKPAVTFIWHKANVLKRARRT
jgi:predicted negative regulator of RcsB-dependent stress response